jgi:sporulation protein YlmC with PRC-barrel domain
MKKNLLILTLGFAAALTQAGVARAQVAGTTTLGVAVTEMTEVANGWSAKKGILGKSVYNDTDQKIGTVQDLIVSPDKKVSYLIIGAGGFIGIARHDVAIPAAQIQNKNGKIVLAGATKEVVMAMPRFDYSTDTARRDAFVASFQQDIAAAKTKVAAMETKAAAATGEAKTRLDQELAALKQDTKAVEDKVAEMNRAGLAKWKEFESDVSKAVARMRKSLSQEIA